MAVRAERVAKKTGRATARLYGGGDGEGTRRGAERGDAPKRRWDEQPIGARTSGRGKRKDMSVRAVPST